MRKREVELVNMVGQAAGEKMDKLADAVRKDGELTRAEYTRQIGEVKEVVDAAINELSAQEKKNLYDLNTMVDIADLDDTEKEFLMAVLYTLAGMTEEVTELQQGYIRSVKKYLGIKNVQNEIDLSFIENIDSKRQTKAILQTVMEFLFLENCNHDYQDEYEDVLDYFDVKASDIRRIQKSIDAIYTAIGAMGLAEKFGYVPEEDQIDPLVEESVDIDTFADVATNVSDSIIVKKYGGVEQNYAETSNYILICDYVPDESSMDKAYYRINKQTGERTEILRKQYLDSIINGKFSVCGDSIVIQRDRSEGSNWRADAIFFNLATMEVNELPVWSTSRSVVGICLTDNYYISVSPDDEFLQICDLKTKHTWLPVSKDREKIKPLCYASANNLLYYITYVDCKQILVEYDLSSKQIKRECILSDDIHLPRLCSLNNQVFVYTTYCDESNIYYIDVTGEYLSLQRQNNFAYNYELILFPSGRLVYTDKSGVLHMYDFATNTVSNLAENASTKRQAKTGLFAKKNDVILPNNFTLIGSYVYFEHNDEVFRIALDDKQLVKVY